MIIYFIFYHFNYAIFFVSAWNFCFLENNLKFFTGSIRYNSKSNLTRNING